MSKIETQLEINGVTYSGKDLSLICLGMSLKEESIIKLLEEIITERKKVEQTTWVSNEISNLNYLIELIKGETNG
jgi:hypothetical protein